MLAQEKFFFNERASASPGKLLQILGLRGAAKARTGSGAEGGGGCCFLSGLWETGHLRWTMHRAPADGLRSFKHGVSCLMA